MVNNSSYMCRKLRDEEVDTIFSIRVAVCCVTFVACLCSLLVIGYKVCWSRAWNTFVHRLKLQLTAVALVVSVLYLLQVFPMELGGQHPTGNDEKGHLIATAGPWNDGCKVIIFLLQYGDWVLLLIIFWLVVYLCRLACDSSQSNTTSLPHHQPNIRYHKGFFEALGTLSAFVVPLLIVWVPFIGGYYGVDDKGWCELGVKISCNVTKHESLEGIGYVMGTWYAPAILVTLAATVGMMVALGVFWKNYRQRGQTHKIKQIFLKAVAPITYLVLFNIINVIDSTNLIYHSLASPDSWNGNADYNLWLTHAVAGPCRAMAIPFGFILSLIINECCMRYGRNTYNQLN